MMKERVKTTAIVLLFVNLAALTCRLWFSGGLWANGLHETLFSLPVLRAFSGDEVSLPKERLSTPRKILINDGSLWIAYYNSDPVFSPLEARTRQIIEGFLRGEAAESRRITLDEWQRSLESVSVYVEYSIPYSIDMLCAVMGIDSKHAPKDIASVRDFIIIPSGNESGVFIIARDASDDDKAFIYRFGKESYSFPREDMAIYTENNSGYYEPAFSTGVEPEGVELDPMVLFSDSRPQAAVLSPVNPLDSPSSRDGVLSAFFNNINTAGSYDDNNGVITYVENYADVSITPGGLLEYKAVSDDKGVRLARGYASYYETVNAAISFAEDLWSNVSREPLPMLVTGGLTESDPRRIHLTLDYYYDGRPVAVSLSETDRSEQLNHGIEMDIVDGRIVSYRQFFRRYEAVDSRPLGGEFVGALDYFVNTFSRRSGTVINDIYIGYMDRGSGGELNACWLAAVEGDDVTYAKEVSGE